jgi:hypothetical protein
MTIPYDGPKGHPTFSEDSDKVSSQTSDAPKVNAACYGHGYVQKPAVSASGGEEK